MFRFLNEYNSEFAFSFRCGSPNAVEILFLQWAAKEGRAGRVRGWLDTILFLTGRMLILFPGARPAAEPEQDESADDG